MSKEDSVFIHSSSFVEENASIGKGTKIWHFCHVMSGATIGKDCIIGQNVFIGEKAKIGNNVKIQNHVSIFAGIELGDFVFCGPSVTFTNVKKPRAQFPVDKKFAKTKVGKGATIGANATIICPRKIGKHAFIGAGAVVTKDIPDYGLVYGNPARLKGYACQCGQRLNFEMSKKTTCSKCRRRYTSKNEKVKLVSR